jgi:hypothetical protein
VKCLAQIGALVLVSGLCLTPIHVQAATPSTSSRASTADSDVGGRYARRTIVNDCYNIVARPNHIDWCGNTADRFRSLRWSSWGAHAARARGISRINDCNPSCADDTTFKHWGVTLRLHRVVRVNGHPRFVRVTYRFTDGPHQGYQNTLPLPRRPY